MCLSQLHQDTSFPIVDFQSILADQTDRPVQDFFPSKRKPEQRELKPWPNVAAKRTHKPTALDPYGDAVGRLDPCPITPSHLGAQRFHSSRCLTFCNGPCCGGLQDEHRGGERPVTQRTAQKDHAAVAGVSQGSSTTPSLCPYGERGSPEVDDARAAPLSWTVGEDNQLLNLLERCAGAPAVCRSTACLSSFELVIPSYLYRYIGTATCADCRDGECNWNQRAKDLGTGRTAKACQVRGVKHAHREQS
jgi:hypothetical protein